MNTNTSTTSKPRPGGHSAKNARRVGSTNTQDASEGKSMVGTNSAEVCGWLGHEWGWGWEPCGEGHAFRVCARSGCAVMESDCDDAHDSDGVEVDGRDGGSAVAA